MLPLTLLTDMHPVARAVIAGTIALLGLLWGYSWIGEPIVVVAPSKMGAFALGPVIVVDPDLYATQDRDYLSWVLSHERVHTLQFALYGPLVMPVMYTVGAVQSLITEGDIWYGNWLELEANAWADRNTFKPLFVVELTKQDYTPATLFEEYPGHFGYPRH